MIRNYLKIAFRNLANYKLYTTLNILGLSIGVASCLLILLYVYHELSYDAFHAKADRIYRVGLNGKIADQEIFTTNTTPPLAFTAVEELPEVQNAVRVYVYQDQQVIRYGEKVISEDDIFFADSTFFDVFSFKLLEGEAATALTEPNSLVIPEDVARKYFGREPALGKTLLLGNDKTPNTVTGILEEVPDQSHFHFSMLRSMSTLDYSRSEGWFNNSFMTYLLVHEGASAQALEDKLAGLVEKYVGPEIQQFMGVSLDEFKKQGNKYGYFLQPLLDIHLHSNLSDEVEPNGDITYVYIFAAIAFFIILLACINFMNLATARSANRAKEVGVRKTLGSMRSNLVRQFLTESVLLSLIATVLALVAAILLLQPFNNLSGKEISTALFAEPWFMLSLLALMLLVGIVAGSYPAFYLSSFRPVEVLKGKLKAGMKSSGIRNVLVVFQFFISITLIICTLLVYQQLEYTSSKNLGFEKENVVVIKGAWRLPDGTQEVLKEELKNKAQVVDVSISNNVPPGVNNTTIFRRKGTEDDIMISTYSIDYEHLSTMQIELLEGRNFSRNFPTDTAAILLNEAAVREFGFEDPLNEEVLYFGGQNAEMQPYKVVGVIKDFNYESLRHAIRPLALMLTTNGSNIALRIAPGDVRATLDMIEKSWDQYAADEPFQYSFLDEDYDALFRAEQRLGVVFSVFTVLAILVACLGLLGLASFMAEQRTKEIGIRKVMGASVSSVILLLSKDFTRLVVVAFVLSIPLAYFIMDWWLEGFAFRISIGPWIFILAGLTALLIAWLTVSWQSARAASANPVRSLRSE
ncbi:putative ABC transport system permease protein [Catalinimonas alkaloidigena]|uniref:ABC transporter permease n=1 Tax=Catalinimonas alkaloidigena TaxID=1075417 RepID=UPI0024051D71|nr:ABC transporter permease [Catalinimonas alkaloidigena]MDF9800162.1 putative ABC transport system permease protein [Catalinimonas alkaloidigena]